MKKISLNIFEQMFKKGLNHETETIKGIPDNYILVGVEVNSYEGTTTLLFDTEEIEEFLPEFKRINKDVQ